MIRGEQHARTGVLQASGDSPRPEAREDRHHGQPRLKASVQNCEDLGHHRQAQRDAVARPQTQPAKCSRNTIRLHP